MFQSLKNARRRSVETVLEAVGVAERTVDPEFELYSTNFQEMMEDMNETGAALTAVLLNQKVFMKDAVELAKCLNRIYKKNSDPTHWPGVENELQYGAVAAQYEEALTTIDTIYRSSNAKVSGEIALTPLRAAVTAMGPAVDGLIKERGEVLKDYDSFQRRLKVLQGKKEQAAGKPAEAELAAEVGKYEGKVQKGKETYETCHLNCKKEIESAHRAHDSLIDIQLLTVLVCQAKLFTLAGQRLEEILSQLPKQKVDQVQDRVNQYIRQGGAKAAVEEKSQIAVGLDVLMGKAYLSDLKQPTEEDEAEAERIKQEELERAKAIIQEDEKEKTNSIPFSPTNRAPPPPPPAQLSKISNTTPSFSASSQPPPPPSPSAAPPRPVPSLFASPVKATVSSSSPSVAASSRPPPPPSPSAAPPRPVPSLFASPSAASTPNPPPPATPPSNVTSRWQPQLSSQPPVTPSAPPLPIPLPPPPPSAPPASKERTVIALFDHEIDGDDELPFQKGDRIIVLDSSDEGWWKGKHSITGNIGIFPVNYVRPE